MSTSTKAGFLVIISLCCLCHHLQAQSATLTSQQELARSIFKELIEINTTASVGNTTVAAEAMAKRLKDAGFSDKDVQVLGPTAHNQNLVARLHGSGKKKPILWLAHLDVVEAKRSDWSMDPFILTEKDGYFYGRGTSDIKSGDALLVADFIRMKKEGFIPDRDMIIALTSGEEGGAEYVGAEWLVNNHRELIDAEYCINMDAGGPLEENGKMNAFAFSASEKGFLTVELEVKNPGGHSSMPSKDNAIYRMANSLLKISDYEFPVGLNEVTKSYFNTMSAIEKGKNAADMKAVATNASDTAAVNQLSQSPYYNALLRTTCVATQEQAGHAENALPQTAKVTVNCRILPGGTQEGMVDTLTNIIADKAVRITVFTPLKKNPASPLQPALMQTVGKVANSLWPDIPVLPYMETGATDGIYLRGAGIPTYGICGIANDVNDNRAHGKDERIGVKAFYDGVEYEYQLMKALAL